MSSQTIIAGVLACSLSLAFLASEAHATDKPKPPPPPPNKTTTTTTNSPTTSPRPEDLFAASAEAYRRGDFKAAIELLTKVYALDPEPSILYNLGRAYEGLGDLRAAVDNYKRFLEQQPNARDRGALEQRIATLERQLSERESLERQRDQQRGRAEEEARERAAKEAELAHAKEREEQSTPPHRSPMPWIIGGVGVAGVATGTVFAVMASSSHTDAVNERQQQKAADLDARTSDQATIANIAFIAGGILMATGVTWWVLEGRSRGNKRTGRRVVLPLGVGVGPGFIRVGGDLL